MKKAIIYDTLLFTLVIALLILVKVPYVKVLLPFILILTYSHKTQGLKVSLGFSKPINLLKLIGMALGIAILISILGIFILFPLIEKITKTPLKLGVFQQLEDNPTLLFTSIIISWVVGGIIEETIFRGFMISKFMKHLNPKIGAIVGIILTSCLFGYLHSYQGISGQLLIGFVGLILGIIYVYSKRNLWLNIFIHGSVDTISMLILYFGLKN